MSVRICDVLIIGGGIAGISVASELARHGLDIVVVDRLQLAQGSSGQNAGGVRQQFSEETNIRAGIDSLKCVAAFEDETGIGIDFHKVGYLFLAATAAQQEILERSVRLQNKFSIRTRMIEPEAMDALVPGMNVDDVRVGCFGPDDGYVDPKKFVKGFATLARRGGAEVLENCPVTSIETAGNRIIKVMAGGRDFAPGIVVNAAGVWAPRIAQMIDEDLPITARRSNLWVARPTDINPGEWIPQVIDIETRIFYHSEISGDGTLVFGVGGAELVPDDPEIPCNWDKLPDAHKRLAHRMPRFANANITRGWAGLVEATPDDNPIVGWTFLDNLYTNAGFSGHGMGIAPGLARQVAAELRGVETEYPLEAFRLERFKKGITKGEDLFGVSVNAQAAGI